MEPGVASCADHAVPARGARDSVSADGAVAGGTYVAFARSLMGKVLVAVEVGIRGGGGRVRPDGMAGEGVVGRRDGRVIVGVDTGGAAGVQGVGMGEDVVGEDGVVVVGVVELVAVCRVVVVVVIITINDVGVTEDEFRVPAVFAVDGVAAAAGRKEPPAAVLNNDFSVVFNDDFLAAFVEIDMDRAFFVVVCVGVGYSRNLLRRVTVCGSRKSCRVAHRLVALAHMPTVVRCPVSRVS